MLLVSLEVQSNIVIDCRSDLRVAQLIGDIAGARSALVETGSDAPPRSFRRPYLLAQPVGVSSFLAA